MQVGERLPKFVRSHAIDIQVHLLVERFVEVAPNVIHAGFVERARVCDQRKRLLQHFGTDRQFRGRRRQLLLDTGAVCLDASQPFLDFGFRHRVIDRQIHQALFLCLQLPESSFQPGMYLTRAGGFVCQDCIQECLCFCDEVRRKLQGDVVVDDRLLNDLGRQIGQIAFAVLATTAQEVLVTVVAPPPGLRVDQAGGSSNRLAPIAELAPAPWTGWVCWLRR
ncbi:hypothetical protein ACW9HJ_31475 [Nocardia gipuzkoensis]